MQDAVNLGGRERGSVALQLPLTEVGKQLYFDRGSCRAASPEQHI